MNNVAIIVGHTPRSPGASSHTGVSEFPFNDAVAGLTLSRINALGLRVEAKKILRDLPNDFSGLPQKVNRLRFADGRGADIALSLHFNAFGDPQANGTEVLYWGNSSKGKKLAQTIQGGMLSQLGTRNRGLRPITSSGARGGHLLKRTSMPCVIIEPGFASNASDWEAIKDQSRLASIYAAAVFKYFGITVSKGDLSCG